MKFKSISTKPMIYKLVASHWQIETKQTNMLHPTASRTCPHYFSFIRDQLKIIYCHPLSDVFDTMLQCSNKGISFSCIRLSMEKQLSDICILT